MPPRKPKAEEAPVEEVEEAPVEEGEAPEPVEEAPVADATEEPEVEEAADAEEVPAEPEAVEDAAEAEEAGVEVGLSPGEEYISERLRDDAVLVVVTNFGRKIEIDPDGNMTVVTGPPLDVIIPAEPVPTPVGALGPKPEVG